jgi:hypothetical protein
MDPSKIYSMTLTQLEDTEVQLTSPKADALLQQASQADRQQAALLLLKVHQARIALGNAALQGIAGQMTANEAALTAGTAAVKAELATLDNIAQVLNTISTLVGIAAQIVPMV